MGRKEGKKSGGQFSPEKLNSKRTNSWQPNRDYCAGIRITQTGFETAVLTAVLLQKVSSVCLATYLCIFVQTENLHVHLKSGWQRPL